jgi:hypothetical protein
MSKEKQKLSIIIAGAVILALVIFYGGMKFGDKGVGAKNNFGNNQQGKMMAGNFSGGQNGQKAGANRFGGSISGEILSIDAKSITVKSRDGGSRIIFLQASTTISRMTEMPVTDLKVGDQVSATGAANTDGSVNAQSVQLRPAGATFGAPMGR